MGWSPNSWISDESNNSVLVPAVTCVYYMSNLAIICYWFFCLPHIAYELFITKRFSLSQTFDLNTGGSAGLNK